jgi:hypothetical protein
MTPVFTPAPGEVGVSPEGSRAGGSHEIIRAAAALARAARSLATHR